MASFVDAVDSHYVWVKTRIQQKNAQRGVKGLLQAQDWPTENVALAAFYLLVLGATPVGPQAGSIAVPHTSHLVQWVWIVKGSELSQDQRMRNRGDRFRIHMQMKDEIIYGLYPEFAEKKTWSVNSQTGVWSGTSYDPPAYVTWTRPQIQERLDRDSGIIYGTVSVQLNDILAEIAS